MVFAFPWLWGLPLAFAGRGAVRCGGYRFCAFVVMRRAALRRVRRLRRILLVSLLRSRPALNYCAGSTRRGGWAASETCLTVRRRRLGCVRADGGVLVAWVTILASLLFGLQDDVSEHGEASLSASAPPALASRGSELSPARL